MHKFTTDTFSKIEAKFGFTFPTEIMAAYLKNQGLKTDLAATIRAIGEKGYKPEFIVQISTKFAIAIIHEFQALTPLQRDALAAEIIKLDELNYRQYDEASEYLLIDGPHLYDIPTDTFTLSIIQQTYEKLNKDQDLIKAGLLTWAHCGGWGHLIIRGKNTGFDGGGMHGEYLKVEHEGRLYGYSSNCFENMEVHHLESETYKNNKS